MDRTDISGLVAAVAIFADLSSIRDETIVTTQRVSCATQKRSQREWFERHKLFEGLSWLTKWYAIEAT